MTKEQEKAIVYLTKDLEKADMLEMTVHTGNESVRTVLNLIQKQQEEIEEKNKEIDAMTDYIVDLIKYNNSEEIRDSEEIKQYFLKKVKDK